MLTMKKIIYLLILVCLISGVTYFNNQKAEVDPEVSLKSQEPSSKKLRNSLKNSRYILSEKNIKKSSFPDVCRDQLVNLVGMISSEYASIITDKQSFEDFFGVDCAKALVGNKLFQKFKMNSDCDLNQTNNGSCFTLLFMLKANFIAEANEDKRPEEMTSEELAAHFTRMFFALDGLKKEEFLANLKLIDVLYNRHIDDPDVLEAYIGYMMIGQKITDDQSMMEKMESILSESEGRSFKVDRLMILKDMLHNDLLGARNSLERLSEKYPKEPELQYYYAAYHWKNGDRAMAEKYLNQAIAMGKNCSSCSPGVYQTTKKKMATASKTDQTLFSISIGLNFENL